MENINEYTRKFLKTLTMDSDKSGHNYKVYMAEAIQRFLDKGSKENAYEVYTVFFDIYRVHHENKKSFIDLLDVLKRYEEYAARLNNSQRDHYIHSVNVFILGICIYSANEKFRNVYKESRYEKVGVEKLYSTMNEEFFFCWGMSALFHDIGYPLEIINNQIKNFISFIGKRKEKEIKPYIAYMNFDKLNCIDVNQNSSKNNMKSEDDIDIYKPTDLLSRNLAKTLGINLVEFKETIDSYIKTMQEKGFIDHGFYSALIVLKWYGEFILNNVEVRDGFYNQIVDSASAIFLHNAYKNILRKSPYSLGKLSPENHPIAYLLILCDEAQEWNRESYGILDKDRIETTKVDISISEKSLDIKFITEKGTFTEAFINDKKQSFIDLLDIEAIFENGLSISSKNLNDDYIETIRKSDVKIVPRIIIENIEKIAKEIHQEYCDLRRIKGKNDNIECLEWEELSDSIKYSNIRQAKAISEKISLIGCYIDEYNEDIIETYTLSDEEVETLSVYEHQSWCKERLSNGWAYGKVKDTQKKISPYLVNYYQLSEEIKELDRDTIRNIPKLLKSIGLGIFPANS